LHLITPPPNCTFEASSQWRTLLKTEFPVREVRLNADHYSLYLWTHKFHSKAISTPFRDRLAMEWGGSAPSLADINRLLINASLTSVLLKDVGGLLQIDEGENSECFERNFINCDVMLDADLEKRFSHAGRKNFRKAMEDYGLEIRINVNGSFESFYNLYLDNRKRLGVLPYMASFFKHVFDWRGQASVVFSCHQADCVLGYLICYLHAGEMISGHLAYDFSQRHKRISDFLFINAFLWGRKNKFTNYRFGADNRNQESLIHSKEKLGATRRVQLDFHLPPSHVGIDQPHSFYRGLLRSMPNFIFRRTGLLTRVYFS
jgi:hypothetical protein